MSRVWRRRKAKRGTTGATRGTFQRLLLDDLGEWGRGLRTSGKRTKGKNSAERRIVGRGWLYIAAGEERSGRGGRYYLRNGRRVDGHDEGGGWYRSYINIANS